MSERSSFGWTLAPRTRYRTRALDLATEAGITDAELARRCGLSTSTISRLRAGKISCGPRLIHGIRQVFPHLTFEELFYLEDAPPEMERPA